MTAIEPYLLPARRFIEQRLVQNGSVPGVYNGYIASFGVDVRQSGVLPALILCLNTGGSSTGDRKFIAEGIAHLLAYDNLNAFIEDTFANGNKRRREVMNAAVAFKMALRTFPLVRES